MDKEEKLISDAYNLGDLKFEKPSAELLKMLAEAGRTLSKRISALIFD